MSTPPDEDPDFVEHVAAFFATEGLPLIAGRVVGRLLICDPPEQSAAELAEALGASRSSIGNATRLLTPSGLVRGARRRGDRQEYFAIAPEAWGRMLAARYARTAAFREILAEGLDRLADAPPERRQRLETVHELYEFLETELPALWERWEARQATRRPHVLRPGSDDGPRPHPRTQTSPTRRNP